MSHNDEAMEQEIQEKNLEAPRVTLDYINNLMARVTFRFEQPKHTTSTFCHAFLKGTFYLATGRTSCASMANFDEALGRKYAQQEAEQLAKDKLFELEGYRLWTDLGAPING